ncbi:LysM peptidoglycan-binding domain-containing protein [Streptomyces guryensis]|uniref:LysM peptidoglycan-binding domain-containing protein n=1 Tax=Streptomyces guryensis TaxID=2886947 RepID=A0A9Q3VN03_9ACTN|nr:transglycosylase family protein [Streptomyces guryensis]MCD9875529.1 LysM peptidoglycan-binding domain-containing protein [Streptomyces guryensis]
MLSGNGRHRRPRQAPALLVAAGVTGSAIAIPLFAAGGASAADGTTWDKVAQCETGGSWSENSGNGFYGGLKLTQENWEKYGGLDYAPSADLASRNQQIAVAEKLLDDQGVGAFHTCGLTSGLTKSSGSADVDTGVLGGGSGSSGSSDSSGASDSTGLSNSSSGSSSNTSDGSSSSDSSSGSSSSASPSTSASATDNSTESGTSASPSTSPSGKATGNTQGGDSSPTDNAKSDDSDNSGQALGSWSLVDTSPTGTGRHRGANADEAADKTKAKTKTDSRTADAYTVRAGDTLASIADSLGLDGGWRALYSENKNAIGTDPNHIFAGQTLKLGTE